MRASCLFVLGLTLSSTAALRAETMQFDATVTGNQFNGSGVLTGTLNGDGSYTLSSLSGPGGATLLNAGTFLGNDNVLRVDGGSFVDANGVAFSDVMGDTAYSVNIHSTGSGYVATLLDSDGLMQSLDVAVQVTPVTATPEPGSLWLLGTGAAGLAGSLRRRLL